MMTYFKITAAATAITALLSVNAFAGEMTSFSTIDANADGNIDFTEFYNAHQAKGMSDTDIAVKFSKFAGSESSFNEETYAAIGATLSKSTSMSETTPQKVSNTFATPMSFADYDHNSDGQVTFAEYSKVAKKAGLETTAAAQKFIRITEGGQSFNASQFDIAMMTNAPERAVYKSQPMSTNSTSSYSSVSQPMQPLSETKTIHSSSIKNGVPMTQITGQSMTSSTVGSVEEIVGNDTEVIVETPEVAIETDLTTGTQIGTTESNMTNSGTKTDLDKSGNPQMKVWGNDDIN